MKNEIVARGFYNNIKPQQKLADIRKNVHGLAMAGRTDVRFEVYGSGEDPISSPFENKFPEERFYNRTVIIDIIPHK